MPRLAAESTILIADPGFYKPRHVPVGSLSVGRRINGAGRLSCFLGSRQAQLLGFDALLNRWVWFRDALGAWAGYVEDLGIDVDRGMVELSCSDMGGLLANMTTARRYRQTSSSPGGQIGRALRDSALDTGSWIRRTVIDEAGAPVSVEWRGENTNQVIRSLASNAGGAWFVGVESDKTLSFIYRSRPTDRRSSVMLVEGHSVIAGSIRTSLSRVVNDLLGVANDRGWEQSSAVRVVSGKSVRLYDRRKGTKRYAGHSTPSSLETVARADLATLSAPSGPVSLEMAARSPFVSLLEIGTLVGLRSSSFNRTFDLTITGLANEVARGVVTVVGTIVEASS